MDHTTVESEFLRPLVNGWLNKIEASATSKDRKAWKEVADECMMFYSQSASAMWNPAYSKKFWKGSKLPRFRVTINKAFEMVAIFGPNLFWEIPHRQVDPKRSLEIPPEMFGQDPQGQQMFQQMQMQIQQEEMRDQVITHLMSRWLNYTPREQPGGGLANHSLRAVVDGLIKGRGVLAPRPYKMPGSGRNLTGAFRESPDDIYLDPDFDSVDECRWMAIKHIDTQAEVEEKFQLPKGSLRGKSTLESSWMFSETSTAEDNSSSHRKEGMTNDLVVWYEIFSKGGLGVMNTNMDTTIRDHMDSVVGQHAYLAICADVPFPLNMSSEKIRKGAGDEDVAQAFSWPVPFWADDRWPVEFLDFYIDPESAYPVAPMAPGLGELKLLNFLMSWFANRTWSSSRDFWAVAQPHLEHYKEYLLNGDDQSIIPTPVGIAPKDAVEVLTQPEGRQDMTLLINFVSDMFDKRVGLTPTIYGMNENQTQNRTAEETMAKQRAVMARPEYMQKQVVDWQSRVAQGEAFVTRWFITPDDVAAFLGPIGAGLWQQHVMSTDIELVVRQFQYTIAASSIRRPNRERDIGNFQQVMNQFAPVIAQYGQATGDYEPWNGMVSEWAELHDADLDAMEIPAPDPEKKAEQEQIQMEAQKLEMQKTQAEIQKLQADAQSSQVEAQADMMQAQMDMQSEQMKQQGEQAKQQGEMAKMQMQMQIEQIKMQLEAQAKEAEQQSKQFEATMELVRDMQKHEQELDQDQEMHEQELEQKEEMAELDMETKKKQTAADLEAKKAQAKIAAQQAKATAAAKPKPAAKKKPSGGK